MFQAFGFRLGECAPCKAMRLQQESNEEFKRRYGMIDTNKLELPEQAQSTDLAGRQVRIAKG